MDSTSSRSSTSLEAERLPPSLGTLSPEQSIAFAELKCLCVRNNMCWPTSKTEGRRGVPGNDHDTLLRYLRARNYDPQAAFKQYSGTAAWRRKYQLDDIYDNAEIEQFEAISRLFPQWTGRRDRRGVPIFVYVVSAIQPRDLLETGRADPDLSSVFLPAENSTQFVQPLCAKMHPNGTMPCSMNIIDLSGVGVRHFWNLRAHLQKASTMATAHYPESVDRIFIIGAPSFFPTIWGFITKWFEPTLTSKISVLPATDVHATLTSFIRPCDLPRRFGGDLDWEYGMHPNLDDEARGLVGQLGEKWVPGPLRYVQGDAEDGDRILALGMEGKRGRRRVLASVGVGGREGSI